MTTTHDTTGPANFGRERGQGPGSDLSGEFYPAGVGSEPDGPEIARPASWIDHERSRAGLPPRDENPDPVDRLACVFPDAPARDAIVDALAEIRKVARDRLGDDGFTIPPTYSYADRQRARVAVYRRFYDPSRAPVQSVATTTGELVDLVAEALGMRRAGA